MTDFQRWSDPQQLRQEWEPRSGLAAALVPPGTVVLDLGCGAMALERHLPAGCTYMPCDVVRRDDRTIVRDFNRDGLPPVAGATLVTALGVIEYLSDARAFLRQLRGYSVTAIVSYCAKEVTAHLDRPRLGWVNHFRSDELEVMFREAGFRVSLRMRIDPIQYLFRLAPVDVAPVAEKAVLVLSYNNVGNFGDRLGFHLVNEVLPAPACVTYGHFEPWDVPDRPFDLVVLGVGNSLFAPLLTDKLHELLERSRSIGIFGTQYRGSIDRSAMARVVERLDRWYARYEEDAEHYGAGRNNVTHLGDWLVNAFSLTRGDRPELLNVGDEIWNNLPLDRVIQDVQSYARVRSTRLHPLLCALTSAWEVSYVEQRDAQGQVSGKFRSMLRDVFAREWPEDRFFEVDRSAVASYKERTRAATDGLRARFAGLLAVAGG